MKFRYAKILTRYVIFLSLAGCVTTPVERSNYYLLDADTGQNETYELPAFKIGLGPVTLPAYLDREGILTYNDKNQLVYSDSHRWAEPLKDSVVEVLRANIIHGLPNQQVVFFPWRQLDKPKYQVSISIGRFGFEPGGEVVLTATWTINDQEGKQLFHKNSDLSSTVSDTDFASIVKAQSRLLSMLSVEIVQELKRK